MTTKEDILSEINTIQQGIQNARDLIKSAVDNLRVRLAGVIAGEPPAQEDLDAVMDGLKQIEATVDQLPVTTDAVETPPAPPE